MPLIGYVPIAGLTSEAEAAIEAHVRENNVLGDKNRRRDTLAHYRAVLPIINPGRVLALVVLSTAI